MNLGIINRLVFIFENSFFFFLVLFFCFLFFVFSQIMLEVIRTRTSRRVANDDGQNMNLSLSFGHRFKCKKIENSMYLAKQDRNISCVFYRYAQLTVLWTTGRFI